MNPEVLFEFIGTFVFLSVIMSQSDRKGQLAALAIPIALCAVIFLGMAFNAGAYNPAVTFMQWTDGKSTEQSIANILAQLIGAYAAYWAYKQLK